MILTYASCRGADGLSGLTALRIAETTIGPLDTLTEYIIVNVAGCVYRRGPWTTNGESRVRSEAAVSLRPPREVPQNVPLRNSMDVVLPFASRRYLAQHLGEILERRQHRFAFERPTRRRFFVRCFVKPFRANVRVCASHRLYLRFRGLNYARTAFANQPCLLINGERR